MDESLGGKMGEWMWFGKIGGCWGEVGNDRDGYKMNRGYRLYGIDNCYGLEVGESY